MPVNFEQLRPQIKVLSESILKESNQRNQAMNSFVAYFDAAAQRTDLREAVSARLHGADAKSCALPREEAIDFHTFAGNHTGQTVNLLAADGSQINPSRHDEISFGLINTAVFWMQPNSGEIPKIITETKMMEHPEDKIQEFLSSEDQVALMRDVTERKFLAKQAGAIDNDHPVIAMTDGPLQLFYYQKTHESGSPLVKEYYSALQNMAARQVVAAGYTDRPRSSFVIEMLSLLNGRNADAIPDRPVLFDSSLFGRFLLPGERSAIFKLISPSTIQMPEEIRISFFYLNCGSPGNPLITRLEIPEWVAADPIAVDLLHFHLLDQTKIIPGNPYPYALHRAHECAVVQMNEKDRIKELILRELLSRGATGYQKSAKQRAKDFSGIHYNDFD